MTESTKGNVTQFCTYCRAIYTYKEELLGFRYCPFDGYKLQPIEKRVPKIA